MGARLLVVVIAGFVAGLLVSAGLEWIGAQRESAEQDPAPVAEAAAPPGEAVGTRAVAEPVAAAAPKAAAVEREPAAEPSSAQPKAARPAPKRPEIVKYVDAQGITHYVDGLDSVPPKYRKQALSSRLPQIPIFESTPVDQLLARTRRLRDEAQRRNRARRVAKKRPGFVKATAKGKPKAILYTAPGCGWCTKAKSLLRSLNVQVDERDISKNDRYEEEFEELGGRGVPVVVVGGEVIKGYNEAAIREAVN